AQGALDGPGVLAIFEEQLLTPSLARGLRLRSPRRALPGIVAREMLLAPSTRDDPLATALDAAGLVATFGQRAAFPPGVVVAAVTLPAVGGPRASLLLARCGAVRHAPSFPQSDCAPGARPRARGGRGASPGQCPSVRLRGWRPRPMAGARKLARMDAGAQARQFDVERARTTSR